MGDTLEIIHPSGNQIVTLGEMRKEGIAVQEAAGGGHIVAIPNMQRQRQSAVDRDSVMAINRHSNIAKYHIVSRSFDLIDLERWF